MIWAPDDCDMVEFNEFPDHPTYLQAHGQTPVRSVFLNAFHARSGPNSTFWNIAASKKHSRDFYEGKLRVAPHDLLRVFAQIKNGTLLKNNDAWKAYPKETPSTW